MRTLIFGLLLIISSMGTFAQKDIPSSDTTDSLYQKIIVLEQDFLNVQTANQKLLNEVKSLKKAQSFLSKKNKELLNAFGSYKQNTKKSIDSLKNLILKNSLSISETEKKLTTKIEEARRTTDEDIKGISEKISRNMLYWVFAGLIILILLLVIYMIIKKQVTKQKTDLETNITETRKKIEEEMVKMDEKLIALLNKQLETKSSTESEEPDHSLALKVADEIVRIEKNIARMDPSIKGIKPLIKGIERIKDNFRANGYEMVTLLEKEYTDEMNIDVLNFIEDDTIPQGKRIITRVIKPQVNYKGVLIQRAQVDVSQN